MIVIGLTGSIGMGKSVTASLLSEEGGGPVQSADAVVHGLYAAGGSGAAVIGEIAPETLARDGSVDRDRLRRRVQEEPGLLQQVENAVHPWCGGTGIRSWRMRKPPARHMPYSKFRYCSRRVRSTMWIPLSW